MGDCMRSHPDSDAPRVVGANGGATVLVEEPDGPGGHGRPQHELLAVSRDAVRDFSHRLRSLATCAGAAAQYLQHDGDGPEVEAEMLALIAEQTGKIHALLDDFLVVVESRGGPENPQAVDLNALARRVVRALAAEAQMAGAWLVLDAAGPVPAVCGDPRALRQALVGAVRTMLMLGRPGERVVIALSAPASSRACPHLTLTVSLQADRGRPERRGAALDRGDLTLAAACRIIEGHGGRVQLLEDGPGLRATLPAQPAPLLPAAALLR